MASAVAAVCERHPPLIGARGSAKAVRTSSHDHVRHARDLSLRSAPANLLLA